MRRTPLRRSSRLKRTGRLRSRRKGHQGTVAGRSSVSPAAWKEMVVRVKARHGNRCAAPWCRYSGPLDVHHVVKRSQGGQDYDGIPASGIPGNLLPLCRRCHDQTDQAEAVRLRIAPVSSDPPLACGFYMHDAKGGRSGFVSLLANGGAIHESF